jgi:hypothetical protein
MRKHLCGIILFTLNFSLPANCQITKETSFIKEMRWGIDYQINLTLANDSIYNININDLLHSNAGKTDSAGKEFVYYPVMLAKDFVEKLKKSNNLTIDTLPIKDSQPVSLWGALHSSIGGGWIHFVNCLQYSIEKKYLSLTSPLMVRPKTNWKPNPVTPTWKRTHNWEFYVPISQKQAHKEYKLKKKENNLANLQDVPKEYIQLFLKTSDKDYNKIILNRNIQKQSEIDLVKLLLGANYLGNAQLTYIKSMVLKSIVQYSFNQLPTIIVFDDIDAAAAMSLNENGYHIDKVVFNNASSLSNDEKNERLTQMDQSIRLINKVNQKVLEERLKKYYK